MIGFVVHDMNVDNGSIDISVRFVTIIKIRIFTGVNLLNYTATSLVFVTVMRISILRSPMRQKIKKE